MDGISYHKSGIKAISYFHQNAALLREGRAYLQPSNAGLLLSGVGRGGGQTSAADIGSSQTENPGEADFGNSE